MIFYLIYYLFLTVSLISLPFLVSNYALAGDPYLLVNTGWYFYLWLAGITFIVNYAFTTTNFLYYCFLARGTREEGLGVGDFFRSLHGTVVASAYTSVYMTLFAILGFFVGLTVMEQVPVVKDVLLSVIHLPGFEFFLKGVPLALGGLFGNIFASFCVSPQC